MPDALLSALFGALGGIAVVIGERFLFSAPSAWRGLKKSMRFYRAQYWKKRGRYVISCPVCSRPDPDPVVDASVLPEGWENAPPDVHWLRCPECGHVWGIWSVITRIEPIPDQDGE